MIRFTAAPAVPVSYTRLRWLSTTELELARGAGYVVDAAKPSDLVDRAGKDFSFNPLPADDIRDWRTKVYVIWFCYLYENIRLIAKPRGAIEELITEFKAPAILDVPNRRLGTLYAGAGASDPLTTAELEREVEHLRPHYDKAVALLDDLPRLSDPV